MQKRGIWRKFFEEVKIFRKREVASPKSEKFLIFWEKKFRKNKDLGGDGSLESGVLGGFWAEVGISDTTEPPTEITAVPSRDHKSRDSLGPCQQRYLLARDGFV